RSPRSIALPADGLLHNFPDYGGDRFGFQQQDGLEFFGNHEVAAIARVCEAEGLQAVQDVLDGAVGVGPLAARRCRGGVGRLGRLVLRRRRRCCRLWDGVYNELPEGMRAEFGMGAIDEGVEPVADPLEISLGEWYPRLRHRRLPRRCVYV